MNWKKEKNERIWNLEFIYHVLLYGEQLWDYINIHTHTHTHEQTL